MVDRVKAAIPRARRVQLVISALLLGTVGCQPTAAVHVPQSPVAGLVTKANAAVSPVPEISAPPSSAGSTGEAAPTVVLDPGHNGGNESAPAEVNKLVPQGSGLYKACDTTGTNTGDGYPEHEFNFQVALLVKSMLEQHGITVLLTRVTDSGIGPCVDRRAAIADDAHAAAAVSIHGDGNLTGHGFQIIEAEHSAGGVSNDALSLKLAEALHKTFLSQSGLTPSTYAGEDGYESRNDLAGLNLSTVPKILVECGNMRDSGDAALMESSAGRQRIAQAIADGILAYLGRAN